MNTMKRLTEAYGKALEIPFNDQSKFILFSDVHRGDNSISDEFAHNQNIYFHAMNHYYNEGFTYIEVGDGDELWEHSAFKYIIRAYGDVYSLLSRFYMDKRFYMLYGNHNLDLKNEKYVKENLFKYYDIYENEFDFLFPDLKVYESIILKHEISRKEIFMVHGHQGDFLNDQLWPITKYLNRHLWHYFHIVGFRNPSSPSKNMHKCHKIEKNYSKWIKIYQKMLIVGHTHRPKFGGKNGESYFNTGSCVFPLGITGIEIENGMISLVKWNIRPDEKGSLNVLRNVLKGPEPLDDYMYKAGKISAIEVK
ncbi:MAG: serine/threonine protein phosphatase [Eubacteriaceae bacterium]|nr:serine/threonine protein phosphatase [Eubacteriaceae bacterium]